MKNTILMILVSITLLLTIGACDKYKKICYNTLEPRVEAFAVSVAKSCGGSEEVAKEYFGKLPKAVCGKKLAEALEGRGKMTEEQVALIACPIIIDAAFGLGSGYLENALQCTRPLNMDEAKILAKTTLCSLF